MIYSEIIIVSIFSEYFFIAKLYSLKSNFIYEIDNTYISIDVY